LKAAIRASGGLGAETGGEARGVGRAAHGYAANEQSGCG
jgi:hypothetical protein